MKKLFFISFFILSFGAISFAQESGYGVGIIVGEPTGLSGKYWVDKINAIDAGVAIGFLGVNTEFSLHTDYLYHINNLIKWKYKLPFYYGFGVRMRFASNNPIKFGVRGVVGIIVYLKKIPVDIFFEIAPSFRLLPTTGLDLDIAIGGRYYLKF